MRDLVIIGGGAAGQAAAMYALGKDLDFLLICDHLGGRIERPAAVEKDYLVGSILVHYDGPDPEDEERALIGSSAVHLFEDLLRSHREFMLEDRVRIVRREGDAFLVETERSGPIPTATVIVATGVTPRRDMRLNGSAGLLADLGHSTTQHASALAGKRVVVVGDTLQALYSVAEFAATALQVYLVLPTEAAADRAEVRLLQQRPNIAVLPGYQVIDVTAEGNMRVLVVRRGDEVSRLVADVAFADLGYEPASALVRDLGVVGPGGFIQVDRDGATAVPGLFAAGDVTRPEGEQVLTAIGDGARAARCAHFYLLTRTMRGSGQSLGMIWGAGQDA
ncbi:MAG: NAD(P)/FAD-dependent oxidoreductase [Oscillochloridaceae bacterium]|nr:NAD(P)/FAD-dependent oxidoreductase [Chloroflexaceae bacterium]MDW8389620.1 NAD(P)/FAD-dependent oxidoreductase [Oscillochloridaceae bacterium]